MVVRCVRSRPSCIGALAILSLGLVSASRLTHQEAAVDDLGNDVVPPSVFSLEVCGGMKLLLLL